MAHSAPIVFQDSFTDNDGTLIENHVLEISREHYPSRWYGGGRGSFTIQNNRLVPNGSGENLTIIPGISIGTVTTKITTPSSGNIYGELILELYDMNTATSFLRVTNHPNFSQSITYGRITSSGEEIWASANPTLQHDTTYELKVVLFENEDRYQVYLDNSMIMDFLRPDNKRRPRQELIGFRTLSSLGTAYFDDLVMESDFNFQEYHVDKTNYEAVVRPGNVGQVYIKNTSSPQTNIYRDSGLQFGHYSAAEIRGAPGATITQEIDTEAFTQFSFQGDTYDFDKNFVGHCSGHVCFYQDRIIIHDAFSNTAPDAAHAGLDSDMADGVVNNVFKVRKSSWQNEGNGSSYGWTQINSTTRPHGVQFLLELGDTKGVYTGFNFPLVGDNARISRKHYKDGGVLSAQFVYGTGDMEQSIVAFYDTGTTYNTALAEAYRNDWNNPATLDSFENGSLHTSSEGDINNDGFNETFGYYCVQANTSSQTQFTIRTNGHTRHKPAICFFNATLDEATFSLNINDALAIKGTDYVLSQIPNNRVMLQLLKNYTTDIKIEFVDTAFVPSIEVGAYTSQ